MAKKNVGMIEKHIEKAVLGIAVLGLLAIMVMYLVTNPHTVEFGGEVYGPSEIDLEVRRRAEALARDMARTSEIPGDRLAAPDWEERLRQLEVGPVQAEGLDQTLAWAVPWGRQVQRFQFEQTTQTEQGVALASFEAPFEPKASYVRALAVIQEPAEEGQQPAEAVERDVNLITLESSYDVAKQQALLKSRYGYDEELAGVVFTGIEVQRQERIGGDWLDWEPVPLYGVPTELTPPELQLGSDGALMRDSARRFTEYRDRLVSGDTQRQILMPPGPVVREGAVRGAAVAKGRSRTDDDRRRSAIGAELRARRSERRTSATPSRKPSGKDDETKRRRFSSDDDAAKFVEATLAKAEQALQQQEYEQARAMAQEVLEVHQEYGAASREQEARALEIAGATADRKPGPGEAVADSYQPVRQYDLTGVPGRTYRYRIRLGILNEYCLAAGKLKDPKDATKPVIYTAWSEPSQPVHVERDTYFYVVGRGPRGVGVRVEIFKWYHNGWIKESFNVQPGEEIGGLESAQVTIGNETYREEVDFFTGAVAVDLAHDVEFTPLQSTSSGFGLLRTRESEMLVYMDEEGELVTRYSVADRTDKRYLELVEATKKPRVKLEKKSTARGSKQPRDRASKSKSRRGYRRTRR